MQEGGATLENLCTAGLMPDRIDHGDEMEQNTKSEQSRQSRNVTSVLENSQDFTKKKLQLVEEFIGNSGTY